MTNPPLQAAAADTVILALGTDTYTAGEGHDATSISLTPAQTELLNRVAAASKSPIIVVMLTATPLDISVQGLRHHFGPYLTDFPALPNSSRGVRRALHGGCACGMLIGACDPM